ncbi:tandem-95 repeat protein [Vibrio bathopelagicus]
MPVGGNTNNNNLNDAVEQVVTDDKSPASSNSNSQNNQQSSAANTVATGTDSVAPLSAEEEVQQEESGQEQGAAQEEGESQVQAVEEDQPSEQQGSAQSKVLEDEPEADDGLSPLSSSAQDTQDVGGNSAEQSPSASSGQQQNSQQSSASNDSAKSASSSQNSNNDSSSDSKVDSTSFGVQVEPEYSIYSDELEHSDTTTDTLSFDVSVEAEADAPELNVVVDEIVTEDHAVSIDISAALVDMDGSEAMQSIVVSDIPEGATLTDGTNTFTSTSGESSADITNWQHDGLQFTTVENFSGEVSLDLSATSVETSNGDTATTHSSIQFVIDAEADAPEVTVTVGDPTITDFDDPNLLSEWSTDNANDHIEIRGEQVYTGITDSERGNVIELEAHPGDESNIYQDLQIQEGETVQLSFDYSARLNAEGDNSAIQVHFEGELIDTISQDSVGWHTYNYELTASSDNPRLEFNAPGDDSVGGVLDNIQVTELATEDNDISIDISAALTDLDGSESMQSIVVDSIPEGATLTDGERSFTATSNDNSIDVNGWQHSELQFTPPENFSGDISLSVSATSIEESNGDTATTTSSVQFTVDAVADAPDVTVTIGQPVITDFDDPNILANWSTDNANGYLEIRGEQVYTGISDSDRGNVIELEAHPGDESNIYQNLTIQQGETVSLSFDYSARQNAEGDNSAIQVYFEGELIDTISHDSVGWHTYNYELTASTDNPRLEFNAPGDDSVGGVLDRIQVTEVATEDQDIAIDISAALTDLDGSESMQSITIDAIPEGATITDGTNTFTASGDDNSVDVKDWAHGDLQFTPAENFNGDVDLEVSATSIEASNGDTSTTSSTVSFNVAAVNDGPVVENLVYQMDEDGTITLTDARLIEAASDVDGDDLAVESVSYSGNDGTLVSDPASGTHVFTPSENFSGDLSLDFSITDGIESSSASIEITVDAVADSANLQITGGDGTVIEDGSSIRDDANVVELNIDAELVDQDLSETLSVTLGGSPQGSVLRYDNDAVINDQSNGLTSFADTTVTVTFEGEGAGFQNSAGYYLVEEDGTISDVNLVYVNASQQGSGGDLIPGQSSFSFDLEAGQSFNLFVIPNGNSYNNFSTMQDGQYEFRENDGSPASMSSVDPQLIYIAQDGTETVVRSQNGDAVFHGGTSTNLNQDGQEHTRTTMNEEGELIYGIEDLYNGGDRDYDDFSFSIDLGEVNQGIYSGEIVVSDDTPIVIPSVVLDQTLALELPDGFSDSFDLEVAATTTEAANQDSATTLHTIHVDANEYAPDVESVEATTDEDVAITVTQDELLANASDVNGDDLIATNLTVVNGNASVIENEDGSYTITPDANVNGEIELSFDVSDGTHVVAGDLQLNVTPVNDGPTVSGTVSASTKEDNEITLSLEELLANADDVEGDELSVSDFQVENGSIMDNGDDTFTITPDENYAGVVSITYQVTDGVESVEGSLELEVEAVNDGPVAGVTSYEFDEDGVLELTPEMLLENSSDVEGDVTLESVTYSSDDGTLELNQDGSYLFTPNENFHGNLSLDVVISDNEGALANTTADITVVSVNDAVFATDDSSLPAAEPSIRLDAAPEHGTLEYLNDNNEWVEIEVGVVYPADTELQYVPDVADVEASTMDIKVGSFDSDTSTTVFDGVAQASDWGQVNGSTAVFAQDNVTITTEVTNGDLTAWNGAGTSVGAGIGDQGRHGLSDDDELIVTVEGEDVNQITFQLDGLGGWFDESNSNATEVIITAYDSDGNVIDSQGGYRESGEYQDTYAFTTDQPVHHFVLGTTGGGGTYVVQNMTVSRTLSEELQLVTIQGDGTEVNSEHSLDLNYDTASQAISVTDELINIDGLITTSPMQVLEDGQLVLSVDDLLANDTDADGDTLTITEVRIDESLGEVTLTESGEVIFTPAPNYFGEASFEYTVTDGNGSFDTANVFVDVIPQQDAPTIEGNLEYHVDEDGVITLTQDDLLANALDPDGDKLTAINIDLEGDASLRDNGDGSYTITPSPDYFGAINISYDVTDGEDIVQSGLQLTVDAVNDAPIAPTLEVTDSEDQVITIDPNFILSQISDVDSTEFTLESISVRSPAQASITQNQDGLYQVVVPEHYNGSVDVAYVVSDGELTTEGTINVNIIAVDDEPFQTGNAHLAVEEDGAVTFNSSDLIELFGDVDSALSVSRVITAEGEEAEGTVVENGNGTWTFTPTDDFAGTTGLQVVVTDGTTEASMDMNVYIRPVADGVVITTSFDGPLVFMEDTSGHFGIDIEQLDTSEVMTSVVMTGYPVGFVVGDGTHSVTITEPGQFVDIGNWNMDALVMTPPENYSGDFSVTVSVVSLDEVEDPADNEVTTELGSQDTSSSPFALGDENYALLLASDLLEQVEGADEATTVTDVSYSGDGGTLIDNNNETWSFWGDPSYEGEIGVDFTTSDGQSHQVLLQSEQEDSGTGVGVQAVSVEQEQAQPQSATEPDYTVAPGGEVNIDIPEHISDNVAVDHLHVIGLPEEVVPTQGLSDGGDGYVISDTSQPFALSIEDSFVGDVEFDLVGMTAMDVEVEGASCTSVLQVDPSYEMQGSSADNASPVIGEESSCGSDWTKEDNTAIGVDVMDDNSSFDNNSPESMQGDDLSALGE